ncbi:hypothetical protein N7448_010564 [Penicillium atrosanguineum]|uniref:Uncharacterized protein n=1 Tax=Penicillium atrosanguineum TaxID=1132637 RepID=A0A9W9TZA1_9EURO|nr:D-aminoacyl-tRNA deacylase [Penicillium atrosanguineum]KAJ5118859.1 hypothetical protein N7526_010496 [Penicillium atrosanguineum]KAJ5119895.1 hypothetical protein N7448_010564 [Penicillium atrosanguineum]KAJ5296896.1 D-aminoacyl-tRNA deacylase [Penicillium atrosanguineum]KAJ5299657.1 hypothetical protein N7476_011214 [Penicillium atrosanguineum]
MASTTPSLGTRLYAGVSVTLLSLWATTALSFTALDILNTNRSLVEPIASISLLTYLICRVIVLLQPGQDDSIAHFLTVPRRSRGEAFAMLLFCGTWLYELVYKAMMMFFMTVFGGAIAAVIYNDGFESTAEKPSDPSGSDVAGTALVEIDEFTAMVGVDPIQIFKRIPPKFLAYFAVLVWMNFGSLTLFVLRLTWKSVKVVLGTPSATTSVEKQQED